MSLNDPTRRLYTGLHAEGEWTEPCDIVCCRCGYRAQLLTWPAAQIAALQHDQAHWAEDDAAPASRKD